MGHLASGLAGLSLSCLEKELATHTEALALLELFEQTRDLLPGEDRPILADVFVSYIAPGALAQTTLHLALKGGHDLTVGEAQIL